MTSPSAVLAVTFKVSGSVASSAAREWYLATGTVSGSPWNNSEVRSSVRLGLFAVHQLFRIGDGRAYTAQIA